jgi:hypothetical protein
VTRLGPLRLVTFAGGRGFVTYQDLGGADCATIARWVKGALAHYHQDREITASSGRRAGTTAHRGFTMHSSGMGSCRRSRSRS